MSALAWGLGGAGFGSVMLGWVSYMASIPRGTVPKTPVVMFITQSAGIALAIASVVLAYGQGGVPGGLIGLAGYAVFMALFFFFLYVQRNTPLGKLQVEVGKPMLAFEAKDDSGAPVRSDDWRGKRVLLKIFRGGW